MHPIMDSLKRGEHRWLNPKAESYDSPPHGRCIRVTDAIQADETVIVYGGAILHKSQMEEYWESMGHVGTQIDDDSFIVPTSRDELELRGVINHYYLKYFSPYLLAKVAKNEIQPPHPRTERI